MHEGVVTTVLDSAMGCSIHSLLAAGQTYTTLEVKVNFVRAERRMMVRIGPTGIET